MSIPIHRIIPLVVTALATNLAASSFKTDFEIVGIFRAPGSLGWQGPNLQPPGVLVGPGPTSGSERLYLIYGYSGHVMDILEVDPRTGEWGRLRNPVPSEYGACMALGPDGNIYLGTRPHAHILRLNPGNGTLVDLGQPAPEDGYSFIYQMAAAADGNIYASTYPAARLLRCEPSTGKLADLGRVYPDANEQYGLWIAADDDGYVYESVGTVRAHLVACNTATGERRDVLSEAGGYIADPGASVGNSPFVYRGADGAVYAVAGSRHFRLRGGTMTAISATEAAPERSVVRLKDGRTVLVKDGELDLIKPGDKNIDHRPFGYEGEESDVFRLAAGPGGRIYGSSILPLHFFEVALQAGRIVDFGRLGHGEIYSFLSSGEKLDFACYDGPDRAPLMVYDPIRPFALMAGANSNPRAIDYPGSNGSWRPEAMIEGPGGKIYLGSVASYGSLDGPLTVWDTTNDRVEKFTGVVRDQSVVSLAAVDGEIIGGTTVHGGGGTQPTQKEAKLFGWDSRRNLKTWEVAPVSGATGLTDLLPLPSGKMMGIATREVNGRGSDFHVPDDHGTLFVFDPKSGQTEYVQALAWIPIYNSVAMDDRGTVWGLAKDGVFRFDPRTHAIELRARTTRPVSAGFALAGRTLFFACGATIYRYRLPPGD